MTTKTTESTRLKDTMRAEYDFSNAVRGKYPGRIRQDAVMVVLAPDVAKVFPDADAVNEALRLLMKTAQNASKIVDPAA